MVRFYCMGVPRSGTTYFSHLMNSHPNVLCGMESLLPGRFDANQLSRRGLVEDAKSEEAKQYCRELLKKKTDIHAFGDKFPRAYFNFERILAELHDDVIFLNVRTLDEVFLSFDARASNPEDSWDQGMIWIFAYIEALYVLWLIYIHKPKNFYLLEYSYLVGLSTRLSAAEEIFSLLGENVTRSVELFLEESKQKTKSSIQRHRPLRVDEHERILKLSHMHKYATMLENITISPVTAIIGDVQMVFKCLEEDMCESELVIREAVTMAVRRNPRASSIWESRILQKIDVIDSGHPLSRLLTIVSESLNEEAY